MQQLHNPPFCSSRAKLWIIVTRLELLDVMKGTLTMKCILCNNVDSTPNDSCIAECMKCKRIIFKIKVETVQNRPAACWVARRGQAGERPTEMLCQLLT